MQASNGTEESSRFTLIGTCSVAAAPRARRRGSVLILVMTLLGVLFVTGMAFLASMNFEADMIEVERQRDRNDMGVEAVFDAVDVVLRAGVVSGVSAPFGGRLDYPFGSHVLGASPVAYGEMPGVHNLFAPIEPYKDINSEYFFRWFTDLVSLIGGSSQSFEPDHREVNAVWTSGAQVPGPEGFALPIPIDCDGDGVTDTFQFDVRDELGFSYAQTAALSVRLNASSNPAGMVYLGMRVIAHGGLVNLNESHPLLIAHVLDLNSVNDLFNCGDDPNLNYFVHRPTGGWNCENIDAAFYSPQVEEPMLRRRALLPPRIITPSLLHGNRLLNATDQKFGLADMPTKLYAPLSPDGFETVFEGAHRYLPFDGLNEMYDPDTELWAARMEPSVTYDSFNRRNADAYDRRHLITTVSYDDLLSRGARAVVLDNAGDPTEIDMRDAMIKANDSAPGASTLPFEYPNYPRTLPDGNARKGRLLLSLPWLDAAFSDDGDADNDVLSKDERQRLIHDMFMMLVRNARGAYWDDADCIADPNACRWETEYCDSNGDGLCHDNVTRQTRRLSLISRTAASLTANMIDYMDFDDDDGDGLDNNIPTRVALRSFDFSDISTVGREFGPPDIPAKPQQFVYGLERQPYITEIATAAAGLPPDATTLQGWAVELYNPYEEDLFYIPGVDEYLLIEVDPTGASPRNEIPLRHDLTGTGAEPLTVFWTDDTGAFSGLPPTAGRSRVYEADVDFSFRDGWIIYLVRRVRLPGELVRTDIVVDQFKVDGLRVGKEGEGLVPIDPEAVSPFVYSLQRVVPDDELLRWMATLPDPIEISVNDQSHTLGDWNNLPPGDRRPVEVEFANTGSFTRLHPDDDQSYPEWGVAFPTTGSLLLLMRHANRPLDDYEFLITTEDDAIITVTNQDLSFTTWLDDQTRYSVPVEEPPGSGMYGTYNGMLRESEQLDNGRMPVFDLVFEDSGSPLTGGRYAHHIHAAIDWDVYPPENTLERPGGLKHLPWGQLVWDYFTALPLRSAGPYVNPKNDPDFMPARADSIPRVDLDGLRVHGRININAAPWKVLGGLPLVPMQRIPVKFRAKIKSAAGLDGVEDYDAARLSDDLGRAIAAYREAREIKFDAGAEEWTTGNYGDEGTETGSWRGWGDAAPEARRGTGFLSVGELANVRHNLATNKWLRIDSDEVGSDEPDYVKAVALLVSLGDWMTVRSHVFTVYGTLRGEALNSETATDVDRRALRFQETVDRLPTFLGQPAPVRIGVRTVAPYIDVRND